MQQHTIQIFMWAWYPESAKIHQKVSGGFWRIQDMSNIYTGGFWWIQDTSILCVTKLVDFGGFRILSSKNTQGVRVNGMWMYICTWHVQQGPIINSFWRGILYYITGILCEISHFQIIVSISVTKTINALSFLLTILPVMLQEKKIITKLAIYLK